MSDRYVHITSRLSAALDLLKGYDCVADVGCDHGRLTAALLQGKICSRVIASDISVPSLEKAKRLINRIGVAEQVSFRVGDGCSVLKPGECDAIAILGMGGTLMCRILEACQPTLMGAKAVVLQPMRAQDDVREYLHRKGFRITGDRIVLDRSRYYQIFKAVPGYGQEPLPDGFPSGFYDVGYRSFADRDDNLAALCIQQLRFHKEMLITAAGTEGEVRLLKKVDAIETILKHIETGEVK